MATKVTIKEDQIRALREARERLCAGKQAVVSPGPVAGNDQADEAKKQPRKAKSQDGVKKLGTRGHKPGHGGRHRLEDADKKLKKTQPWKALGMSQRTWYSRRAEQRQKEKQ